MTNIVDEIKFQYVIIQTGYTARTITHFRRIGVTFDVLIQNPTRNTPNVNHYEKEATLADYRERFEGQPDLAFQPVLVKDKSWGQGAYLNTEYAEAEYLDSFLDQHNVDWNGSIIYSVSKLGDVKFLVETLDELGYCKMFGIFPYEISMVKVPDADGNPIKFLMLKFDSESG